MNNLAVCSAEQGMGENTSAAQSSWDTEMSPNLQAALIFMLDMIAFHRISVVVAGRCNVNYPSKICGR